MEKPVPIRVRIGIARRGADGRSEIDSKGVSQRLPVRFFDDSAPYFLLPERPLRAADTGAWSALRPGHEHGEGRLPSWGDSEIRVRLHALQVSKKRWEALDPQQRAWIRGVLKRLIFLEGELGRLALDPGGKPTQDDVAAQARKLLNDVARAVQANERNEGGISRTRRRRRWVPLALHAWDELTLLLQQIQRDASRKGTALIEESIWEDKTWLGNATQQVHDFFASGSGILIPDAGTIGVTMRYLGRAGADPREIALEPILVAFPVTRNALTRPARGKRDRKKGKKMPKGWRTKKKQKKKKKK